ncbi:MAG: hypothetical protein HYV07_31950 [Deltaproteobacteria bacterium]|nr:hypothetical protein [Deltaproteobacteria bacterium]
MGRSAVFEAAWLVVLAFAGCGDGGPRGPADTGPLDGSGGPDATSPVSMDGSVGSDSGTSSSELEAHEAVRRAVAAAIAADPISSTPGPATPDEYEGLARKLAAIPGVGAADYSGDALGTIFVEVQGGGTLIWRHRRQDLLEEMASLPPDADFRNVKHPTYNAGWQAPERPPGTISSSNSFATRLPTASERPDPEYLADDSVPCSAEGRVAIVDFQWTDAQDTNLYDLQWNVDGVMLWDKVERMFRAAGFTVDRFKDDQIKLENLDELASYDIVITIGHGARPSPGSIARLGMGVVSWVTPQKYEPSSPSVPGMTQYQAWRRGYIFPAPDGTWMAWSALLFRDLYHPRTDQIWLANQCWTLMPHSAGLVVALNGNWSWRTDTSFPVYTVGDGLMAAGAKAVLGYVSPSTPEAVKVNTMSMLRRLLGGYFADDLPPAPFTYWPACLSAQTYFRLAATPQLDILAVKIFDRSVYAMYAVSEPQYMRKVCAPNPAPHFALQTFMLRVGTPATALTTCWDEHWQSGAYPNELVNPLCGQGDRPTTAVDAYNAACQVRFTRKVTNSILLTP